MQDLFTLLRHATSCRMWPGTRIVKVTLTMQSTSSHNRLAAVRVPESPALLHTQNRLTAIPDLGMFTMQWTCLMRKSWRAGDKLRNLSKHLAPILETLLLQSLDICVVFNPSLL